jgi:hypothetical protein
VLIAEAATVFFSTASANEAAHRLHTALARYESGAWRRERSGCFRTVTKFRASHTVDANRKRK